MKTAISHVLCGITLLLCCYACNKKSDTTPPPTPASSDKVMVSLQPGGEFTVDQSPLPGAKLAAKTTRDSTYYSVEIKIGDVLYGFGIFDRVDSLHFLLDPATTYRIRLVVFQKGTGPGLYTEPYNWGAPDDTNHLYITYPVAGVVNNIMYYRPNIPGETITFGATNIGAIPYQTFNSDSTYSPLKDYLAEVTTYCGTVSGYKVDTTHPAITIPMKRLVFGIQYNCPQLTQGRLVVTYLYPNEFPTKIFYPTTIDNSLSIYSCGDYLLSDTLNTNYRYYDMYASIVWELPDGRKFSVGNSSVLFPTPTRNHLLNVNVTLPTLDSSNSNMSIKLSDTIFSNNTPIRF